MEKRYRYKNIKVKPETYAELVRAKAVLELQLGRRVSMDDFIQFLLSRFPPAEVEIRLPSYDSTEGSEQVESRRISEMDYSNNSNDDDYASIR